MFQSLPIRHSLVYIYDSFIAGEVASMTYYHLISFEHLSFENRLTYRRVKARSPMLGGRGTIAYLDLAHIGYQNTG